MSSEHSLTCIKSLKAQSSVYLKCKKISKLTLKSVDSLSGSRKCLASIRCTLVLMYFNQISGKYLLKITTNHYG